MSTSFGKSAEAGTAAGVLPAMRSRIALAAVMSLPSGNPRLSYSAQARLRSGESKPLASSRCGRTRSRFRLSNGVGTGAGVVSDRDESLSVVGSAPRQGGADSSANPHCGCGLQAAGLRGSRAVTAIPRRPRTAGSARRSARPRIARPTGPSTSTRRCRGARAPPARATRRARAQPRGRRCCRGGP